MPAVRAIRGVLRSALLASVVLCATAQPAQADDAACVDASERALSLRNSGKLREALKELGTCAVDSCPKEVGVECTKRMETVAAAMPTLVLGAVDEMGSDLREVAVSLDGAPLVSNLDGRPVPVDPGPHTLRFEAAGRPTVTKDIVLREGEKDRREVVTLSLPPGKPPLGPLDPGPSSLGQPRPTWWTVQRSLAVVAGVAGIASIGVGLGFGALAASDQSMEKSNCSPGACPNLPQAQQDYSTGNENATASTVLFVAGGALVVTGVVLLFTAKSPAAIGLSVTRGTNGARDRGFGLVVAF